MPRLDTPLQLSPVFKEKIWGRHRLAPLFADVSSAARQPLAAAKSRRNDLVGEAWITDDASRFLNGPCAGMTLGDASKAYGAELHGAAWKGDRFPILAKYLFTSDWLSIQVHPDDDGARARSAGSLGKCEMWYIVSAERGAEILLGLKSGVTKKDLRAAAERGASRRLLHRFHPQAAEAMFIPPGTLHALGPGLVLFEAEQNSDLTYRLDDFGRVGVDGKPRPLHLEKGLEATRLESPAYRDLPRVQLREPYGSRRYVLACRHFAVEELRLRTTASFESCPERVETLSVVEGNGRVETDAGWMSYRTGETWLIPPFTGKWRLVPRQKTRALKFYVPDLERDFRKPLLERHARVSRINKLVFGYRSDAQGF